MSAAKRFSPKLCSKNFFERGQVKARFRLSRHFRNGSWLCENSMACRSRGSILINSACRESERSVCMLFDTELKDCISTFFRCMSNYTARVTSDGVGPGFRSEHFRCSPFATEVTRRCSRSRWARVDIGANGVALDPTKDSLPPLFSRRSPV
jgi:hypothetical protein